QEVWEKESPVSERSAASQVDVRAGSQRTTRAARQSPHIARTLKQQLLTTFRINTCKSVTKQTTLTLFRMNTYAKPRGREVPLQTSLVATQASAVTCTTWHLIAASAVRSPPLSQANARHGQATDFRGAFPIRPLTPPYRWPSGWRLRNRRSPLLRTHIPRMSRKKPVVSI